MTTCATSEPVLSADFLAPILEKLGLTDRPKLDLAGLNRVYASFSCNVPNDNIQKRIWFASNREKPVTGGDPIEFFKNWLGHGTGGTCFPTNGGLYALLRAIGFDANRISGSVMREGVEPDNNHGSVLVKLEGIDYLVDGQLGALAALPLMPGEHSSTGNRIHDIQAIPIDGGFAVQWFPGSNRQDPVMMHLNLANSPVDHQFFLTYYNLSASRERQRSNFNDALFISRHFPDSILIVSRGKRTKISSDNTVIMTEITDAECARILVEELDISEEMVNEIPPDEG